MGISMKYITLCDGKGTRMKERTELKLKPKTRIAFGHVRMMGVKR